LALAPLAHYRGAGVAPGAAPELAIDVDGDGRADRVRLLRHEDAWWLDVALARAGAQPDELALRSTTRVAPASAGERWSLSAADVNGDGKMDVLVRDAGGHTTAWISDGIAFTTPARTDEPLDSYRREQS
ncbi:MAG: FG-GAP repeat domain-containing protein, partial [Polyangia bacterium]